MTEKVLKTTTDWNSQVQPPFWLNHPQNNPHSRLSFLNQANRRGFHIPIQKDLDSTTPDGVKSILWSPVTQPTSTSVPRLMSHFTDSDTVWHRIKSKQTDRMENTAGKTLQILVVHGILGIPDRPPNVNVQVSVSPNELMELDFQ